MRKLEKKIKSFIKNLKKIESIFYFFQVKKNVKTTNKDHEKYIHAFIILHITKFPFNIHRIAELSPPQNTQKWVFNLCT